MSIKFPQIIGHRGCAAYAPENTLPSIYTAADMGVDWVELDIKLTKDQVPVIFHDETLDRTTDSTGFVKDHTLAELKELDAGLWFGESFFDTRIPTLEQAVDALIECELGVNFEIKPCEGRERETAEVALDMLSQIWDDHNKILISSFSPESVEVTAEMAHGWARALCVGGGDELLENWAELAKALEVNALSFDGNTATQEQIMLMQEAGLPMLAYTINDEEQARALQSLGIRSFFTDSPDILQDVLFMVH